jgi:hypothetical protein
MIATKTGMSMDRPRRRRLRITVRPTVTVIDREKAFGATEGLIRQ